MKKKNFFPYIVAFTALAVAFSAAFFSVFGISMLFAGAKTEVIVMAGSLEFAKLILASFLYRYWVVINKAMRIYMMVAVFVLMIITSGGIYGYLSSAYQDTATKYEKRDIEISTLEQRKNIDSIDVARLQGNLIKEYESKDRYQNNLDTLYNRRWSVSAKRIEEVISKSDVKINQLDSAINVNNTNISELNKQILDLQTQNISGEIGPLKYIADLTGLPMNQVVNIFILLLIFVFDPLAITMVVGANIAFQRQSDGKIIIQKDNEKIKEKNETPIIQEEITDKIFDIFKNKKQKINKNIEEREVIDGGFYDNDDNEKKIDNLNNYDFLSKKTKDDKIKKDLKKISSENNQIENLEVNDFENVIDAAEDVEEKFSEEKKTPIVEEKDNPTVEEKKIPIIEEKEILPEKEKDKDGLDIYGDKVEKTEKVQINKTITDNEKKKLSEIYRDTTLDAPSEYTPGGGIIWGEQNKNNDIKTY